MSATNAIKRVEDSILALHGDIEDESLAQDTRALARKQAEDALAHLVAREVGIPLVEGGDQE